MDRRGTEWLVVHHTAFPMASSSFDEIRRYHMEDKGWKDIGYHFFIDMMGVLHTGRSIDSIGAHCLNYNSTSLGICLAGNFEMEHPTGAQLLTLHQLLEEMKVLYPSATIVPHCQLAQTLCPGFNLKEKLAYVQP